MLKGKNAIITGCNRGIGKAMVARFAENGANIWACARTQTDEFEAYCREIADKNNVWVTPVYFDLRDENAIKGAFLEINKMHEDVDILVNNAGVSAVNRVFQMSTMQDISDVINTNVIGTMSVTQKAIKMMLRRKKGSVVNISSIVALYGEPSQVAYAASKGAISSATKKLASEYGELGIRVNAIAPGLIKTDMMSYITPEYLERIRGEIMLGRFGEPEEIANVAAFLGSDLSSYINGQIIEVSGGLKI